MRFPIINFSITVLSALCAGTTSASTGVLYDFTLGLDMGITTEDRDNKPLAPDAEALGFGAGKAWIPFFLDEGMESCVASSSWFKNSATADDRITFPTFRVEGDDPVLAWMAKAYDAKFRDGYSVYITVQGEKFPDVPAFSVKAEEAAWTPRSISLSDYNGKDIAVTFVNDSRNKSILLLDDVYLGERPGVYVKNATPSIVTGDEPVEMQVMLWSDSPRETPVSVSVECESGGFTAALGTLALSQTPVLHKLGHRLSPIDGGTLFYEIGCGPFSARGTLSAARITPFVEEGTDMDCGYCVRGVVALEQMKEKYGDEFVCATLHQFDDLKIKDYPLDLSRSSIPVCVVNRQSFAHVDPLETESYWLKAKEGIPAASLALAADVVDKEIKAHVTVTFTHPVPSGDMRIGFVLTENNVWHRGYFQKNSYAGSGVPMGGFESLPPVIDSDFSFSDVARAAWGGACGYEDSLPADIIPFKPYEYGVTLGMPGNIDNISDCRLIAVLLRPDGTVATCGQVSLGSVDGVESISGAQPPAIIFDRHTAYAPGAESISVYSPLGLLIAAAKADELLLPDGKVLILQAIWPDGRRETRKFVR